MKLYNNFTGGSMNKDLDLRVFPKGIYIDAQNIRITSTDSQSSRAVNFALGNTNMTSSSLIYEGTNPTCIGSCVDTFRNLIYYAVATSTHSYIIEYDVVNDIIRTIVDDVNSNGVFLFTTDMYVEMRVINDNDNGKNFLILTDNVNEPKFFEIDTVEAITVDSYTLEDVSLIKGQPLQSPILTLGSTLTGLENNLETKFLSFAYRYKYQNDEYSALSSFSEFAFLPDSFSYNYKAGTNSSMFNSFSKVDIEINTGSSNVSEIQLIVKESGSNTAYIVETYNKSKQSPVWGDNTTETVTFDNSRIYKALDSNQLTRIYDNVPVSASTLEVIGNRIVFGNYTEGYDLEYQGIPIDTMFSLDYSTTEPTAGSAHNQVKTNRDYEVAISYYDGLGRWTTPITSPDNTTFIPYSAADKNTTLQVTIDKSTRPPDWATHYKFYIKQSKTDYDVIAPIIFYREGIYAWVKLEGNDVQKVGEGDFLYVKSDTGGLKSSTIRTKVLEIAVKEVNFLEATPPDPFTIIQEAGTYMRLQVEGYSLNDSAVEIYEFIGYSFRSNSNENNIAGAVSYIEPVFFDGSGLNDLTASGTITAGIDARFQVEIMAAGSPDTYRWRKWDTTVDPNTGYGDWQDNGGLGFNIIAGADNLSDNISITFEQTTGHTVGSVWNISAKSATRVDLWDENNSDGDDGTRSIMSYQAKTPPNEAIIAGAQITITYDDAGSLSSSVSNTQGFISLSLSSSRDYPNIEEWFYGDNIISSMGAIVSDVNDVLFRRGTLSGGDTGKEKLTVTGNLSDPMVMSILSPVFDTGDGRLRIDLGLNITEFDNNIIFETIPVDVTTDIFFEVPYVYSIAGGVHQGDVVFGDTTQSFNVANAVINLKFFNSFGWGNGFESYKIADTFNEKTMIGDVKPLIPIDNYRAIRRIASLTYSDVYESTTQYNSLNEFNLAEANYKDMDIKYGAIAKLHSRDTDLIVFQHDKTHRVLFSKSVLFNGDGSGNVSQSSNVLGQEIAFTGEYGICNNPESFAFFGNRIYHLDKDRGALMRLSTDGYTEISKQGLSDYFRKLPSQFRFVGGYDLYNDEYLINVSPDGTPSTLGFEEGVGFTSFYGYEPERLIGLNNRTYSIKNGQVWLHDSNTTYNNFYGDQKTASITTVFNDSPNDIKHFKSVNTESTSPWDAIIAAQSPHSTITADEFSLEEFEYYAYIRQGETLSSSGISNYQGLGEITNINSLVVNFGFKLPRNLAIGDIIYELVAGNPVAKGMVTDIDVNTGSITLDSTNDLSVGDFVMYGKQARVEGEPCKGYTMQLTLTNNSSTANKLFAVKTEAVRSFD